MKNYYQNKGFQLAGLTINEILIFLIWPFGSLLYAFRYHRAAFAKKLFLLFCVYFGFVFIVADPFSSGTADSSRYYERLIKAHQNSYSFDYLISTFYNPLDGTVDLYEPIITWLVSLFTDDPRVLFAVFALVFGYFYSQNIWMLLKQSDKEITIFTFLFILLFALLNPIWNINGVRMYTAAHVFLFGILQVFIHKKTSGVYWILSSILIHFSFAIPILVFLLFRILPKNIIVFSIFFFATGFISEINLSFIRFNLDFLPEVFKPRVVGYTNEEYLLSLRDKSAELSWHIQILGVISRNLILAWVLYAIVISKSWKDKFRDNYSLLLFGLLIGGFANLASLVPSGGRFLTISNSILIFSIITIIVNSKGPDTNKLIAILSVPFMIFLSIVYLRMGLDYIGYMTFIGNPLAILFIEGQTPIIEFVKMLF